ncbi:MAG: hypothetical protein ABW069_07590 [Duganella sp.]
MKRVSPAASAVLLASTFACALCAAQDGSSASIAQTGSGNRSFIGQVNTGDVIAEIVQRGTNNMAGDPASQTGGITQIDAPDLRAWIDQSGDANRAAVTQRGGWHTIADQVQSGAANVSAVRQVEAYETVIRVAQSGARNQVDGDAAETLANGFTAVQTGDGNTLAVVNRHNGFSTNDSRQEGVTNDATMQQADAIYTSQEIAQLGERNRAIATTNGTSNSSYRITQQGADNLAANRSTAERANGTLTQTGERHAATAAQRGADTDYTIVQLGNRNTVSLVQAGAGRSTATDLPSQAVVTQAGSGLQASLAQTGASNRGFIVQQ